MSPDSVQVSAVGASDSLGLAILSHQGVSGTESEKLVGTFATRLSPVSVFDAELAARAVPHAPSRAPTVTASATTAGREKSVISFTFFWMERAEWR